MRTFPALSKATAVGLPRLDFKAGRLFGPPPAIVCTVFWPQAGGAISPRKRMTSAASRMVLSRMVFLPLIPRHQNGPTRHGNGKETPRKPCIESGSPADLNPSFLLKTPSID